MSAANLEWSEAGPRCRCHFFWAARLETLDLDILPSLACKTELTVISMEYPTITRVMGQLLAAIRYLAGAQFFQPPRP